MKWQLLHKACWAGDAAEVRRLIEAGADPNQVAPTTWRQTPLGRTLEFRLTHPKHNGHVDVVRVLLEKGADPARRSTYLDMTPYELACFCGLAPAAELLRDFSAVPHPHGMSPLWLAAASRLREEAALPRVRDLVGVADPNAAWRKATPLMMALGHAGHPRVADLLLEAGADPGAGTSILHACCDWHLQHLLSAIEYLASKGWNVNAHDQRGQTALHKAAFLGYAAVARRLLALGADPAAMDQDGLTPADLARRWRKVSVAKLLEGRT